jgi:hypothetical protein
MADEPDFDPRLSMIDLYDQWEIEEAIARNARRPRRE